MAIQFFPSAYEAAGSVAGHDTWNRKLFSESSNRLLDELQQYEEGADLLQLMQVLSTIHPEYSNTVTGTARRPNAAYDGPFQDHLHYLQENSSRLHLPRLHSAEWAEEIRSVVVPPSGAPVLNGRMCLIAALLLQYSAVGSQLPDPERWQQKTLVLMNALDQELAAISGKKLHLLLTEKGHVLFETLQEPVAPITKALEELLDTPNISDVPTREDALSRKALSQYLARRLRHIYQRDIRAGRFGSFFMHIDGAWGSGKSTLLGFLQEQLETPEPDARGQMPEKWIVVNFNAWENQRLDPPWWFLMKGVYRDAVDKLKTFDRAAWFRVFFHEWRWRINTGSNYLYAALATLLLFILARVYLVDDADKWNSLPFVQLVSFIGFLWSLTKFLRNSLVPGSAKAAQSFIMENGSDPMQVLAGHFKRQVARIGYPVAVFIDDLDRCNKDYGIKLLEGLQTIFRKADVVYVVAADRKWLATMYEDQYALFAKIIARPTKPFGLVFLDKTFQLTLELPDISDLQKRMYWNKLLNIKDAGPSAQAGVDREAIRLQVQQATDNRQKMNLMRDPESAGDSAEKRQLVREAIVSTLSIEEEERTIEHRLQKFVDLIEPNPRAMKRLINDISTANAITFLYDQQVDQDQLVLWTIFKMQHPLLAEYFWNNPKRINEVGGEKGAGTPSDIDSLVKRGEVQQLLRFTLDGRTVRLDEHFLRKMKFQSVPGAAAAVPGSPK